MRGLTTTRRCFRDGASWPSTPICAQAEPGRSGTLRSQLVTGSRHGTSLGGLPRQHGRPWSWTGNSSSSTVRRPTSALPRGARHAGTCHSPASLPTPWPRTSPRSPPTRRRSWCATPPAVPRPRRSHWCSPGHPGHRSDATGSRRCGVRPCRQPERRPGARSTTRGTSMRRCWFRHGESVKVVQTRLGHATAAETLDTYSHLWPDSEDRTQQAVDSVLAAAPADSVRTGCAP